MQFVDKCNLIIKAGNGGNGIVAWRREAHVEFGGPAGGDGGDGGSVYLKANHNETSLFNLRYIKKIQAEDGVNGQSENKFGAKGKDKIIYVPVGTMIYDKNHHLIVDMNQDNMTYLICQGGKGGKGNTSFKSSSNKAPSLYELGDLGEEKELVLELKEIADVGLIGLPNAGKSTFLKTTCNVNVKIGDYPFTTIHPVLGTYYFKDKQKIIFCDIPGLIEGAALGKGLGHEFLKHVERCKILLHFVSGNELDHKDIIEAYETINHELSQYNVDLKNKKIIVVVTKADTQNALVQYQKLQQYLKQDIAFISCETYFGVQELLDQIQRIYNQSINNTQVIEETNIDVNNQISDVVFDINSLQNFKHSNNNELNLNELKIYTDQDNNHHLCHPVIAYWVHKIPLTTKDNILRFNQKMRSFKLNEILKKHGFHTDDEIYLDQENVSWIID